MTAGQGAQEAFQRASCGRFGWMVGNPHLGITSGLPVNRPEPEKLKISPLAALNEYIGVNRKSLLPYTIGVYRSQWERTGFALVFAEN